MRSTALATSLAFAMGLVLATEVWAKPKVPLPKPRPVARNVVPSTTAAAPAANAAARTSAPNSSAPSAAAPAPAPAAPALSPATRQHAAIPPPRKPGAPAAMAATSSTSQADKDALENVIELLRKHKP